MLVAFACVDADGAPLLPCGRCRQLLWEHGGPALLVDTADGPIPMGRLLPRAFGREDLERVAQPSGGADDAQTPTGGVLVVADTSAVSDSSSALPARLPAPEARMGMVPSASTDD